MQRAGRRSTERQGARVPDSSRPRVKDKPSCPPRSWSGSPGPSHHPPRRTHTHAHNTRADPTRVGPRAPSAPGGGGLCGRPSGPASVEEERRQARLLRSSCPEGLRARQWPSRRRPRLLGAVTRRGGAAAAECPAASRRLPTRSRAEARGASVPAAGVAVLVLQKSSPPPPPPPARRPSHDGRGPASPPLCSGAARAARKPGRPEGCRPHRSRGPFLLLWLI